MVAICIKCGDNQIIHKKRGLCHTCYCAENYQKNKEVRKQKSRDRRIEKSDSIKESKRQYYLKNKTKQRAYEKTEAVKQSIQKWRSKNKGLLCYYANMRHERCIFSTPNWVDTNEIKEIYRNRPIGHAVDHIIPLVSKDVCGLNVPWNMQYLTTKDNHVKYNKFDFTYNNISWQRDVCLKEAA